MRDDALFPNILKEFQTDDGLFCRANGIRRCYYTSSRQVSRHRYDGPAVQYAPDLDVDDLYYWFGERISADQHAALASEYYATQSAEPLDFTF